MSTALYPQLERYATTRRLVNWWNSPRSASLRGKPGLITTYVLSRVFLVLVPLGFFPYSGGKLMANDVVLYNSWAQVIMSGHYPVNDPMWQYPPLAGFVFAIGSAITSHPTAGFIILALLADLLIFVTLLRRGLADGRLTGAWTYTIAGLAIGPVMLSRFDIFPTVLAVFAVLLLAKPVRSGILLGFGTLLKVWPAFLIVAHPRRALPKVAAAMIATVIAGMSLLSLWGPGFLTFMKEQGDRGLQIESVGGIVYVVGQYLGLDVETVFRYGSMEINATGAGFIASFVTIAGFVTLGVIAYARLRGRLENVAGADVALAVILVSIASSRVFSPQYMVWVAGIAGVCMLSRQTRMKPIIWLLMLVALFGQLVYPFTYGNMMTGGWYGVLFQSLRIGLLMVATVWAVVRIMRPTPAAETNNSEDHVGAQRRESDFA